MTIHTARVAPSASILIESMRDIGYSLESALADVIDNSIAGDAKMVALLADTSNDNPRIAVIDDGRGMSQAELLEAMRPGSRSPLDSRNSHDLGRFGLGLKTASFSQCRRLTVVSRKQGTTAAACWDLDYVATVNDWLVQIPSSFDDVPWTDRLGEQGTIVLWEKLDRLADAGQGQEVQSHLLRQLNDAADHLELVFHRFLTGERGVRKTTISINDRNLIAFDPFHSSHPATIVGPPERIRHRGHDVLLQSFTLPHHKKVTPAEWERYAGRAGYTRNQGFYLYRGKRLIIHGTWFGLARQMELTKLARVRIDMPNELDAEWKIDVKKSSAHPPRHVRERLRQVIDEIGAGSKRIYRGRGHALTANTVVPVWRRIQEHGEIRYRLNADHPFVAEFVNRLSESLKSNFAEVLELAGAALPIDALFADIGAQPERVAGEEMSSDAYRHAVSSTCRHLQQGGFGADDILEMLRNTEPFRSRWEDTEELVQHPPEGGKRE